MSNYNDTQPILKWVGGKRQLLPEIEKYFPPSYSTYYEPFVGGGAVLFNLRPYNAVISDMNEELINLYQVIKTDVEGLVKDLQKHENTEEYFYKIRSLDRDGDIYESLTNIQRASRLIFLNKTCFNGLYRVNKKGQFNTPFGRYKNPNIINESTLRNINRYFNEANIKFVHGDFNDVLMVLCTDSFIYLDPPYDPVSNSANFTGYSKDGFSRQDQERLKKLCDYLNNHGIRFLLSNSYTEYIMELYKEYTIEIVLANRNINTKGNSRGKVNEVLIRNYNVGGTENE